MPETTFDTWAAARAAALARDGFRCSVARLLGGGCSEPPLHVHHLVPRNEGGTDQLDNLLTVCSRHHPMLERLRTYVLNVRGDRVPPCRHVHRYRAGREACERQRRREAEKQTA